MDVMQKNTIGLFFHNHQVCEAFEMLIEAMGKETQIIETFEDINTTEKLITEPSIYCTIPDSAKNTCLVIGRESERDTVPAPFISQPLTSEKIECNLRSFLFD